MSRRRGRRPSSRPGRSVWPAGTLRVIGGRFRGRPIQYLGDPRTRPMKQRVREAAFNLIGKRVVDTHVVDLFAGTGALTWEALSRGAISAVLLERHFPSTRILHDNAAALGVTDRVTVLAGDTFLGIRHLPIQAPNLAESHRWLVFCSPPYDFYVSKRDAMLELIQQVTHLAPSQSLIVVEADRRLAADSLPHCVTWDRREYPPATLSVGEIEGSTSGDQEPLRAADGP